MAEIVAALGLPHNPFYPAIVARDGESSALGRGYAALAAELDQIKPDALVIFDSDHLNTFFLNNYPNLCIGVAAQTNGPNDHVEGMPSYTVPVSEDTAFHLYEYGLEKGFDFALTQEFQIDHSMLVPLHFLRPQMDMPIVPIYLNGIVPPLPTARRCFAVGEMVRDAIRALPRSMNVAVIASGSLVLDIGSPLAPHGQLSGVGDTQWYQAILGHLRHGRTMELMESATADQLRRAGNIGGELLNWIAMLGAIGSRKPTLLEESPDAAFAVWRWDREGGA